MSGQVWGGSLFDGDNNPYVRDAIEKHAQEHPAPPVAPSVGGGGCVILPNPEDVPEKDDDFDKNLQDMLQQEKPDEDPAGDDQEVDCTHCNGTGKIQITANGDEVQDEQVEYSQPENPTPEQTKKMAQWRWDEEKRKTEAEIEQIRKEYGKE